MKNINLGYKYILNSVLLSLFISISFLNLGNIAYGNDNPYNEYISTTLNNKLDNLVSIIKKNESKFESLSDYKVFLEKFEAKLDYIKIQYKTNKSAQNIAGYLLYELELIMRDVDNRMNDVSLDILSELESFAGGNDAKYPANNISYCKTTFPSGEYKRISKEPYLLGGLITNSLCQQGYAANIIDNGDKDGIFKYDCINNRNGTVSGRCNAYISKESISVNKECENGGIYGELSQPLKPTDSKLCKNGEDVGNIISTNSGNKILYTWSCNGNKGGNCYASYEEKKNISIKTNGTLIKDPYFTIDSVKYPLWPTDKTAWAFCQSQGFKNFIDYRKDYSNKNSPIYSKPGSANYNGQISTYQSTLWGIFANGNVISEINCSNDESPQATANLNNCLFSYTVQYFDNDSCIGEGGTIRSPSESSKIHDYALISQGSLSNGYHCSIQGGSSAKYIITQDNGKCHPTEAEINKANSSIESEYKQRVERQQAEINRKLEEERKAQEDRMKQEELNKKLEALKNRFIFENKSVNATLNGKPAHKITMSWDVGDNYKKCILYIGTIKDLGNGKMEMKSSYSNTVRLKSSQTITTNNTLEYKLRCTKSDSRLKDYEEKIIAIN